LKRNELHLEKFKKKIKKNQLVAKSVKLQNKGYKKLRKKLKLYLEELKITKLVYLLIQKHFKLLKNDEIEIQKSKLLHDKDEMIQ
jgi:hypothetical protein